MKTVPLEGSFRSVSFFEDDTIETVREHIAVALDSHPDRLRMEVRTTLPASYYQRPTEWADLFLRLSWDGETVRPDQLRTYVTQIRIGLSMAEFPVTKEEWMNRDERLRPLWETDSEFEEWRLLGTRFSLVLPTPPTEVPLSSARIPMPQTQSLWETLHPYPVTAFRAQAVTEEMSEATRRVYFSRLRPDTPSVLDESVKTMLETNQVQMQRLLDLEAPSHESVSIVRAKWYIPLASTQVEAPRTRFEQIFYGLTLSKTTPYIGYFTAKTETLRHKLYVEDPKTKSPVLDTSLLKGWLARTMPQRRKPTLLVYRGTAGDSFDRIAITDKDITVDVHRPKSSRQPLEELRSEARDWLLSMDALVPFLDTSDVEVERWELSDLSAVAGYSKDIEEFDLRRLPCLRTLFSYQNDAFRLLRSEHSSEGVTPQILEAYQILNEDRRPEALQTTMGLSPEQASDLFETVTSLAQDINLDKSAKAYPVVKFSSKEAIVRFVSSSLERTLKYMDILRYVLTSDSDAVNQVCPRRMEMIEAKQMVSKEEVSLEDDAGDLDLLAELELETTAEVPVEAAPQAQPKVKVVGRKATYGYFVNRLQSFDPNTFDKSLYPGKCDKPKQAIVLTPEDKIRVGTEYNYDSAPESERLELSDPTGTVICPPYWCMRDEIPLREDQLVEGRCPRCNGQIRPNDKADPVEYPVLKRNALAKYPDYLKDVSTLNKRRIPCCFQTPRSKTEILDKGEEDESYVRKETATGLPAFRLAYLPEDLAARLRIKTDYKTSINKGRLGATKTDFFRVGLGRPSKTLPSLLGDKTPIPSPKDAPEQVKKCSFFRTWREVGEGKTSLERIVKGIDTAYREGRLSVLEEVEYVTTVLRCNVILVDGDVGCGFWSYTVSPTAKTLVMLGKDALASVTRKKAGKSYKMDYSVDLPGETLALLLKAQIEACSTNLPTLADAIAELQIKGKTQYTAVLDPFGRTQAILVPGEVVYPITPTSARSPSAPTLEYKDIPSEVLPQGTSARTYLGEARHPGFHVAEELEDATGMIVELRLASGFRVPIRPEAATSPGVAKEVITTVQSVGEDELVNGSPNAEDLRIARETTYAAEMYEFLLYSLSKDIQSEEYARLRTSIESRSTTLYRDLERWYGAEAYSDTTASPLEFVNKVRAPCGQFLQKDSCTKSSLCGWHRGTCKIRVKPVVDKASLLRRMVKALRDNDKQRALVLDARLSPFFSTILYLEMPHELITTSL